MVRVMAEGILSSHCETTLPVLSSQDEYCSVAIEALVMMRPVRRILAISNLKLINLP